VVDERLRARGVPIPERISKRRLLEEMARRYDKATQVRGRPHNETRLVRGMLTKVRIPGRRRTHVDRDFANSFCRAVKLLNQRYGIDILSVYTPPSRKPRCSGFPRSV